MVPWRNDILKNPRAKYTEEELLLRDGWQYVNITQVLTWKDQNWTLIYKVIENKPRRLPGFNVIDVDHLEEAWGNKVEYRFIEFRAVNHVDRHIELYAYGNFLKGKDKPYLMRGRQIIRVNNDTKSNQSYTSDNSCTDI